MPETSEINALIDLVGKLLEKVERLEKRDLFMNAQLAVIKGLTIPTLATAQGVTNEEATNLLHGMVHERYEAEILRLGDHSPVLAKRLDLHVNREAEWD